MTTVSPEKQQELLQRMQRLKIYESDLIEKFILGSGSAGQKINKTACCVYLKHLPSGIEIKCHQGRSRELNRFLARRSLCDRIEAIQTGSNRLIERKSQIQKQKKRRARRLRNKD